MNTANTYRNLWRPLVDAMESVTLRNRPFAGPDSLRLAQKLHAKEITQVEAMRLEKRLKRAGLL